MFQRKPAKKNPAEGASTSHEGHLENNVTEAQRNNVPEAAGNNVLEAADNNVETAIPAKKNVSFQLFLVLILLYFC